MTNDLARRETMSGLELSGYINVKMPLRERKFGLWKPWKRQWCMIRHNGNSVILRIGNNKGNTTFSVMINEDIIVYRIESRSQMYAFGIFLSNRKYIVAYIYLASESEANSQKWMSNIRCLLRPPNYTASEDEFDISLIDNKHSQNAGLIGLYGSLSVTPSEIVIKDWNTGKVKVTWHWSQISHNYLPLPPNQEDVHKICTLCTSRKFKCGEGELEIFCLKADELHEKLTTCLRFASIPKIIAQPLLPNPQQQRSSQTLPPVNTSSSMSTSDSPPAIPPHSLQLASRRLSRSDSDLRSFFFGRTLNNLHDTVGSQDVFLLSSNKNVVYMQKVPSLIFADIGFIFSSPGCSVSSSMNDIHRFSDEKNLEDVKTIRNGRIGKQLSKNSVDSQEYDEINLADGEFDKDYKSIVDTPPPLPPRKSNDNFPSSVENGSSATGTDYLPMAPNNNFNHKYTRMANLNFKNKILVSGPIPV